MKHITNKVEVDDWVYAHAHVMGHVVRGIKGHIKGRDLPVNIMFEDVTTKELINIEWGDVDASSSE